MSTSSVEMDRIETGLEAHENPPEGSTEHKKFYESNAGDGTTVYDHYLTGAPLILCCASCFITSFLIGLDQTIVITALSTLGKEFNAYDKIGWITSGFMLSTALFSMTWGNISIIIGRKWAVLAALVIFEGGSLMCALATNINILIGGRVLAGIGGSGIQAVTNVITTELVPINNRSLVFVFWGLIMGASTVCGPLIGGAITENISWRWCFYINLPIGGVAGLCLLIFFNPPKPKSNIKEKLGSFDYLGNILLIIGLVLLLLGLTFGGNEFAWNSGAVISFFVLGGLILIGFFIWNFKYSKNALIPLHIIKVPGVVFPMLSLFFTYFCFMGCTVYLSTYFQVVTGSDAIHTGYHIIPLILSVVIAIISMGVLIKVTRLIKPYAVLSGVLSCVGIGTLSLLDVDSSSGKQIGLLILPGVAIGIITQLSTLGAQLMAPKAAGSTIMTTTLMNFVRPLGSTIGTDVSQTIFNSSFKSFLRTAISKNPDVFEGLGFDISEATTYLSDPTLLDEFGQTVKDLFYECVMKSLRNVFYTSTGISGLTLIATIFYSNKRVPKPEEVEKKKDNETDREESAIPAESEQYSK